MSPYQISSFRNHVRNRQKDLVRTMMKLRTGFLFFPPLFCAAFPQSARAQQFGNCNVSTPFSLGAGVTVKQCFTEVSTTGTPGQAQVQLSSGSVTIPLSAGDSGILFGYQCFASGSNCGNSATVTYLFPCANSTCSTGAISGSSFWYQAELQNPSNSTCGTNNVYCNYVWYIPSPPSLTNIFLVCSSTAPPTFTSATNCQFITGLYVEIAGGCTLSGTGCLDQTANNSLASTTTTTVTTPSPIRYSNELCVALGGTVNDETLTATNGGTNLAGNNANVIFGKTCGVTSFAHAQATVITDSSATVTSLTTTLASNPATGDLVMVGFLGPSSGVTCKDANNNNYIPTSHSPAGGTWNFYLANAPANASKAITCSFASSAFVSQWADDFTVTGGTVTFDTDVPQPSGTGSGTTINSPSITPLAAGELLYSTVNPSGSVTAPTSGNTLGGWTGSGVDPALGGASEYQLASASGATSVDYTTSDTNDTYQAIASAFKIAPTGLTTQTLGQSWTGTDTGGMIMVTLQTARSVPSSLAVGLNKRQKLEQIDPF
jgi:hypothetical protein